MAKKEVLMTAEEDNWRKEFETIGTDQLRLRLEFRRVEFSPLFARAAESWILEQDTKKAAVERSRYRKNLAWAIAGFFAALVAIAAVVSALPVVRGFLN
jgi:hypothetical protein